MKNHEIARRIEAFDAANGGGVGWYEDKGAYHLYLLETEAPIARLSLSVRVTKSGSATGHIGKKWDDPTTCEDASCRSIKPSTTLQTRHLLHLYLDLDLDLTQRTKLSIKI